MKKVLAFIVGIGIITLGFIGTFSLIGFYTGNIQLTEETTEEKYQLALEENDLLAELLESKETEQRMIEGENRALRNAFDQLTEERDTLKQTVQVLEEDLENE